jgi:acetylornithine deacetylase/succinyl-diaminopimelate desuccinylase-like protein
MNLQELDRYIGECWDRSILPTLCEYIRIPNKSIHFDPQWQAHGHMRRAAELLAAWCRKEAPPATQIEILELPGRTPLLLIDVPASSGNPSNECVLMYGHMDKQPEFDGWETGLAPWTPVMRGTRLYGRGGADDGYAVFSSLLAIKALSAQDVPYSRCVILIEASEESGSPDLPAYVEAFKERIGEPTLVVCLDAECGNYEQWWCTTSLRGNLVGVLRVDVLREGVHSGMASGIVPSSFRIARALLNRIEDANTGEILLRELHGRIPPERITEAVAAAQALGPDVFEKFPRVSGLKPLTHEPAEQLLNSTWRPTLSVTGADGMPSLPDAGNVLRPFTALKLSFRLPPGVNAEAASRAVKHELERDPPHAARVTFTAEPATAGWDAPPTAPWLREAIQSASQKVFDRDAMWMGVGGTIPFMGMLHEQFPRTQFLVTGVLGPQSNAHGPNEFLEVSMAKKVTACVSLVLAAEASRR